jgi:hypothetical protein
VDLVHGLLNLVFFLLLLLVVFVLVTATITPAETVQLLTDQEVSTTCPYAARQLPCPTCGLTRSVIAALQGNFSRSKHFHPDGRILAGFLSGQLLLRLVMLRRRWRCWKIDLPLTLIMLLWFVGLMIL